MRISKKRILDTLKLLFWAFLFKVLFDYIYRAVITQSNFYWGVIPGYNIISTTLSYVYLFLVVLVIAVSQKDLTRFFLNLLAFSIIIPMLSFYSNASPYCTYHAYMFMCVFCFFIIALVSALPFSFSLRCLQWGSISMRIILSILFFLTVFTIAYYFSKVGVGGFNLNLNKVYKYRIPLREILSEGIIVYAISFVLDIGNLFCLVYFLYNREYGKALFFLMTQIVLFGFSSHKMVLFSAIAAILLLFLLPYLFHRIYRPAFLASLGIAFMLIFILFSSTNLLNLGMAYFTRVFVSPGKINFFYYEYFREHGFAWFSHSFLRHFVTARFTVSPGFLIGELYSGNPSVRMNTGFLGAGYMQGGFVVMVLYAVLIGVFIRLLNTWGERSSPYLVTAISALPFFALFTSADLPAAFVGDGLGALLILISIMSSVLSKKKAYTDFSEKSL